MSVRGFDILCGKAGHRKVHRTHTSIAQHTLTKVRMVKYVCVYAARACARERLREVKMCATENVWLSYSDSDRRRKQCLRETVILSDRLNLRCTVIAVLVNIWNMGVCESFKRVTICAMMAFPIGVPPMVARP